MLILLILPIRELTEENNERCGLNTGDRALGLTRV